MAHTRRERNRKHKGERAKKVDEKMIDERTKVDLNRASREQLMRIPGVSQHMAEQLIEYREQPGEPERPEPRAEPWHMSERTFDELVDRLYI